MTSRTPSPCDYVPLRNTVFHSFGRRPVGLTGAIRDTGTIGPAAHPWTPSPMAMLAGYIGVGSSYLWGGASGLDSEGVTILKDQTNRTQPSILSDSPGQPPLCRAQHLRTARPTSVRLVTSVGLATASVVKPRAVNATLELHSNGSTERARWGPKAGYANTFRRPTICMGWLCSRSLHSS